MNTSTEGPCSSSEPPPIPDQRVSAKLLYDFSIKMLLQTYQDHESNPTRAEWVLSLQQETRKLQDWADGLDMVKIDTALNKIQKLETKHEETLIKMVDNLLEIGARASMLSRTYDDNDDDDLKLQMLRATEIGQEFVWAVEKVDITTMEAEIDDAYDDESEDEMEEGCESAVKKYETKSFELLREAIRRLEELRPCVKKTVRDFEEYSKAQS